MCSDDNTLCFKSIPILPLSRFSAINFLIDNKMKLFPLIFIFIFYSFIPLYGQVSEKSVVPDHPRILLQNDENLQLINRVKTDSLWHTFQEQSLKVAGKITNFPLLKRELTGKRLLDVSREALYRISMLSYAYRTTGDTLYAKAAEKEMVNVCGFVDWNPSHFLDVAEMTTAVSIGYDWLYGFLSEYSRTEIRNAIINKGLKPSLLPEYNSWLMKDNNWNQVCNAAMTLGALAIWDDNKTLATKIVNRSLKSVRLSMANYGPDGGYAEGYAYWQYGTTFNVMMIDALEKVFGSDFGLSKSDGFLKTPYFITNMVGQNLAPFNFGDSNGGLRLNPALFWFAHRLDAPSLIGYELIQLSRKKTYSGIGNGRFLPAVFIWGAGLNLQRPDVNKMPVKTCYVAQGEAPVCVLRTSEKEEKGICVALKGGSPASNSHTHMDEGSFIIDVDGLRWAMDFGPQDYYSIESKGIDLWNNSQYGQRWTIFRYNNFAHNVVSVDHQLFDVNGKSKIDSWSDNPLFLFGATNTTSFYGGKIKLAKRGIAIINKEYIQIQDELQSGNQPVTIEWRMVTPAKATISGKTIVLEQDGEKMILELSSDDTATPEIWSTQPENGVNAPNPGTVIVGFATTLPVHTVKTLIVRLFRQGSEKPRLISTPIDNWK